jgi:hypothetical protein
MSIEDDRKLAIQIEAQQDLYFFSRYMFKERRKYKWRHNWHHRVVCDALMKVFNGEIKRLIINIPPRYSKTELAVINFMAWCFGKVPDSEFIHISYSATLAANNAFQTRNLVQEQSFKSVFLILSYVMTARLRMIGAPKQVAFVMPKVLAERLQVSVQVRFVKVSVVQLLLMTHTKPVKPSLKPYVRVLLNGFKIHLNHVPTPQKPQLLSSCKDYMKKIWQGGY